MCWQHTTTLLHHTGVTTHRGYTSPLAPRTVLMVYKHPVNHGDVKPAWKMANAELKTVSSQTPPKWEIGAWVGIFTIMHTHTHTHITENITCQMEIQGVADGEARLYMNILLRVTVMQLRVIYLLCLFFRFYVSLDSLVFTHTAVKIRRESSISSCLLDLNSCMKSIEPSQVWLHTLLQLIAKLVFIIIWSRPSWSGTEVI